MEEFEDIFSGEPTVAYSEKSIDHITKYRRQLGDVLFIDRLLTTIGVENGNFLYCHSALSCTCPVYVTWAHRCIHSRSLRSSTYL